MALVDQEATFRGGITDHAVSLSKNDFPQLILSLEAKELYDDELEGWNDWSDVDENQINAYLILIDSKNNETLNYKKVQEALGWDGKSFAELAEMDLSEVQIQFRVESRTYQEKTTMQVTWIDTYDATPGKTLRKLDAKELKSLDAKFKNILKGKATPAKAPAAAASKPSTLPKAPSASKPSVPPKASAPKKTNEVQGKCTKDEAWEACVDLKDDRKVTDQKLAEAWTATVEEVAPNKTDEQITPEEWFTIREKVLAATAMF